MEGRGGSLIEEGKEGKVKGVAYGPILKLFFRCSDFRRTGQSGIADARTGLIQNKAVYTTAPVAGGWAKK